MDFWERCASKEGMSICTTGVLIGIILTLILVWIYMTYMVPAKAEWFTDPNSLDPQTQALLNIANANDPTSNQAMKRMYGSKM
jgi:hypothetical protein